MIKFFSVVVLSVLREELSRSVADRLTATDVALKDGISRLVASKVSCVTSSESRVDKLFCRDFQMLLLLP